MQGAVNERKGGRGQLVTSQVIVSVIAMFRQTVPTCLKLTPRIAHGNGGTR